MVTNMNKRLPKALRSNSGVTYIMLVAAIVIIGITTSIIGQSWKTASRMEKEEELLWRGNQIRQAIKGYYEYRQNVLHRGQPGNYYPTQLQDLVSDPGRVGYRWLRKIYDDPMTGKDDWVLVRAGGGIKGIHSSSTEAPLKMDNFRVEDETFRGKTRYAEWVFEYTP